MIRALIGIPRMDTSARTARGDGGSGTGVSGTGKSPLQFLERKIRELMQKVAVRAVDAAT